MRKKLTFKLPEHEAYAELERYKKETIVLEWAIDPIPSSEYVKLIIIIETPKK